MSERLAPKSPFVSLDLIAASQAVRADTTASSAALAATTSSLRVAKSNAPCTPALLAANLADFRISSSRM